MVFFKFWMTSGAFVLRDYDVIFRCVKNRARKAKCLGCSQRLIGTLSLTEPEEGVLVLENSFGAFLEPFTVFDFVQKKGKHVIIMEDANASSRVEESIQQQQPQESVPVVESISQRLEVLENSVRYLENTMMTRLSTLEGRVEELMRRMDGFSERWSQQVLAELSTVLPDAPPPPPPALPLRQKKRQCSLTARRVKRRYQRLVQSSWKDKSPLRHIRRLERKRRQRT